MFWHTSKARGKQQYGLWKILPMSSCLGFKTISLWPIDLKYSFLADTACQSFGSSKMQKQPLWEETRSCPVSNRQFQLAHYGASMKTYIRKGKIIWKAEVQGKKGWDTAEGTWRPEKEEEKRHSRCQGSYFPTEHGEDHNGADSTFQLMEHPMLEQLDILRTFSMENPCWSNFLFFFWRTADSLEQRKMWRWRSWREELLGGDWNHPLPGSPVPLRSGGGRM